MIEVQNESAWLADLDRAFGALALDGEDAVAGLGSSIAQNMRDAAPVMDPAERAKRIKSDPKGVRKVTGRFTIRSVKGRDRAGFYVDVGPSIKAFYLAFIEYGTSKLAARPFLRPAIERAIANWGRR